MTKWFIGFGVIVAYLIYHNFGVLINNQNIIIADLDKLNSFNAVVRDRFEIKEQELINKEYALKRYEANYNAFNATACQNCHLAESLQFPFKDRAFPTFQEFLQMIRTGND